MINGQNIGTYFVNSGDLRNAAAASCAVVDGSTATMRVGGLPIDGGVKLIACAERGFSIEAMDGLPVGVLDLNGRVLSGDDLGCLVVDLIGDEAYKQVIGFETDAAGV